MFFFLDFWPIKLTLWKSFGESSCDFFWTVGDLVANSWIHKIWLRIFRYKHEMNETLHPWKLTAGSPKHHPALKSGKNHLSHPDLHFFGFKMLIFQVFMPAWKQERRVCFFVGACGMNRATRGNFKILHQGSELRLCRWCRHTSHEA